jgi:hypothetical protein
MNPRQRDLWSTSLHLAMTQVAVAELVLSLLLLLLLLPALSQHRVCAAVTATLAAQPAAAAAAAQRCNFVAEPKFQFGKTREPCFRPQKLPRLLRLPLIRTPQQRH